MSISLVGLALAGTLASGSCFLDGSFPLEAVNAGRAIRQMHEARIFKEPRTDVRFRDPDAFGPPSGSRPWLIRSDPIEGSSTALVVSTVEPSVPVAGTGAIARVCEIARRQSGKGEVVLWWDVDAYPTRRPDKGCWATDASAPHGLLVLD